MIDPQDSYNANSVRYWIADRGLVEFRFHPMYYPHEEKVLTTSENRAMWEEIATQDAVIQFHTTPVFADQVGYPQLEDPSAFQPLLDLAKNDNLFVKILDVHGRSVVGRGQVSDTQWHRGSGLAPRFLGD